MIKTGRRALSLLLCIVTLLSLSCNAFASETYDSQPEAAVVSESEILPADEPTTEPAEADGAADPAAPAEDTAGSEEPAATEATAEPAEVVPETETAGPETDAADFTIGSLTIDAGDNTKGKNYDNNAYYSVSWGAYTVPSTTETYISYLLGGWSPTKATLELAAALRGDVGNVNSLVWYAWVDATGKWNGHINGTPVVVNSITDEEVEVTAWKATITEYNNTRGFLTNMGTWSVSGEGSVINADTIADNLATEKGQNYDASLLPDMCRVLAVRLFLSDGNSIQLCFSSDTAGISAADAITANGGRMTRYGWNMYTLIGSCNYACLYLNTPNAIENYHFYIEKTVTGLPDGVTCKLPVNVSINGGAPVTVELDIIGNGTFTKEVTFTGYPDKYTATVSEDSSAVPGELTIVSGSDTASASLTTVGKNDGNTASIENKATVLTLTYNVQGDVPADFTVPATVTGIAYNGSVDALATVPTTECNTATGKDDGGTPGTWAFTGWKTAADFSGETVTSLTGITSEQNVYGKWTFTPTTYTVTYTVQGDPTYGTPDCTTPDPDTGIAYNDNVALQEVPTTDWNTATGKDDGGTPGTWAFTGWKTAADLSAETVTSLTGITSNQNVYGQWVFTPTAASSSTKETTGGDSSKASNSPQTGSSPKTGDSTDLGLWLTLFALCMTGLVLVPVYKRRKNTH